MKTIKCAAVDMRITGLVFITEFIYCAATVQHFYLKKEKAEQQPPLFSSQHFTLTVSVHVTCSQKSTLVHQTCVSSNIDEGEIIRLSD